MLTLRQHKVGQPVEQLQPLAGYESRHGTARVFLGQAARRRVWSSKAVSAAGVIPRIRPA